MVPVFAITRPRVGRRSRRRSSVPETPATASEDTNASRIAGSSAPARRMPTSARAVRRSRRESPDPSTMRTPATGTPATRSSSRTTRPPAALEPIPCTLAPSSLRSISDTKLSLSRFMFLTIATSGSERSSASGRPFAGARPVVIRPATVTPRRASAALKDARGGAGRAVRASRGRDRRPRARRAAATRARGRTASSLTRRAWRRSGARRRRDGRRSGGCPRRRPHARAAADPGTAASGRLGRRGRGFPARRDPGAAPCR